MTTKFNLILIGLTLVFGAILIFAGLNPMIALIGGGMAWFMFHFLWSPPPKQKDFSDVDRLDALYRGIGVPPELPTPEMHKNKHHKHKDKE